MSIVTNRIGTLEYMTAEGISAVHAFTTRLGGVSEGAYASLNLAFGRGDDPEKVVENYRILGCALGFPPESLVLTRQTHSDIVRAVGRGDCMGPQRGYPVCDALVTNEPGVTLGVFTADCTPLLLHDPVTGAVGAAHAGWRGTAAAIGAKTVEAMVHLYGSCPQDICAAVGPNIGFCHFQTDADVPAAMLAAFGTEAEAFIRRDGEKYYVNLKELNALCLRRAGVEQIELSTECTVCRPDRFWSHRVTQGRRGSQGAFIRCGEART